jgi:uncharacterized coiled-coil DUF342 family protein
MLCLTYPSKYLSCSERRKIERRVRRLEKLQRTSSGQAQDAEIAEQLSKLKEDLEYVTVSYILNVFYLLF